MGDAIVFLRDRTIKRRDICDYLESDLFYGAFSVWKRWKRFGFYNPGGPSGQPAHVIRIIDVFEDEKAFIESERIRGLRGNNDDDNR